MRSINHKIRAMSDEKKCVILLALTIFMGFMLFYTYIGDEAACDNDHEGIIRLHVIANSNEADDQQLKLKVRDAVIAYMDDQDGLETVGQTRRYIKRNTDTLEAVANGVIAAEGYDYTATADLGVRFIPEKTYGNTTLPAGNYEALNITLGEGSGENWWCVIFPPLCLLDEGTLTEESVAADEYPVDLAPPQELRLKWKLLELIDHKTQ